MAHHDHPAVVETRLVHNGQRRATSVLAEAFGDGSAPRPAVAELRDFVVATLDHHHRTEDDRLWPILTAAAPELTEGLGRLSREHERLDEALAELAATDVGTHDAAPGLVVRDLVHEHLSHEEPVLFPALRAHVTDEQWTAFSRHVVDTAPATRRDLLVGFLDRVGSDDEVELLLRHPPPPAREALPDTRLRAREVLAALAVDRPQSAGTTR